MLEQTLYYLGTFTGFDRIASFDRFTNVHRVPDDNPVQYCDRRQLTCNYTESLGSDDVSDEGLER